MSCITDECVQGRQPCPTPGECCADKPLTLTELLDVPPFSLDRVMLARFLLGVVAVLTIVALLVFLAVTLWPILAASVNN